MKYQNMRLRLNFICLCLSLVAYAIFTQDVIANDLAGAWKLKTYETAEKNIKATGLLVLQGKNFGMIYLMESENGNLSARSHTGKYYIEDNRLFFDVQLWVEEVDNLARIIPAMKVGPRLEINGEELILKFDSGSVQTLSKLSSIDPVEEGSDWQLKLVQMLNGSDNIKASLVTAGNHFVLVYLDKDLAGWGYGGLYDYHQQKLVVYWSQVFKNGQGSITNEKGKPEISTEYVKPELTLVDPNGNILEFTQ